MKALILAAGYGTRLHPLTKDIPKPLLEIAGKPIITHIAEKIAELSFIEEIYVVTNDKFFNNFSEWSAAQKNKNRIFILNDGSTSESDRLGAVGDIDFAVREGKIDDDLLIIGGDNLFEFGLLHLHNIFTEKQSSVIALYDILDKTIASKKLGVVSVDESNKIIDFEEKPEFPKTSLVSTACYILSKKDLGLLQSCIMEQKKPDNLGDFIKWLSKRETVYAHAFSERWMDIGTLEQYEKAKAEFKSKS